MQEPVFCFYYYLRPMQSFLEKIAHRIHANYGDDISQLCIVLPNRRAGLFLRTHFANIINKTFWAPEVLATEDFVALLSELEMADTTTLLFELYETVKSVGGNQVDSFDDFSKWGQLLLNDLNEIDSYLVDAKQLFGNLKDIKELETWTLNKEEELTDFQKQYVKFWQSLGDYYFDFKKRLLSKHLAYQGLSYRVVAENLEEKVNKHNWKKIIFAGFNALNKAEEKIIEGLLYSGKAEVIWDVDRYYVNDLKQEAGKFFRKYKDIHRFSKAEDADERNSVIDENLLSTEKKQIHIIGATKNVAQAKLAGNIVQQFQQQDTHLRNTALVLADENLLFPVLHSLPENLNEVNVTMGYPLRNTPVAGYFDLLFNMHLNASKLSQGKAKYSYYHKDLLNLLNHPYTNVLIFDKEQRYSVKPIVKTIQEKNILFAALTTIEKLFVAQGEGLLEILRPLFKHWSTPADGLTCVHYLIDALKNAIVARQKEESKNANNLELEYLFAFTKIIKRIEALMKDYPHSIADVKTLHAILKQIVRGTTLPFYGEPLMGLQVMGMLETRTLDFENIILLSCNENVLPSGKSTGSFIPFELKSYFGLPTYSDKDAIFAYHFYRLLQRAKNIYLLYNTESDVFGSGEKSRFLTQLMYELPKANPQVEIKEGLFSIPVEVKNPGNNIRIKKTTQIVEQLKAKAANGFSPSLLNRYVNCSLQFYFQAIAGLKEAEDVEETIGAETLGNVIHEVLETLYRPFVGKKLNAADVKEMKKQVQPLTEKSFGEHYSNAETSFGKNVLIIKVALKFINNFLDSEITAIDTCEKQGTPLIIKKLEEPLETDLKIGEEEVKFRGKADRIDSVGAIIRFVDYKTGRADDRELRFEEWDELRTEATLAKSFQLLMYAWMYHKMNPAINDNMVSGIVTFRELSKGLKTVKVNNSDSIDATVLNAFEEQLKTITAELLNPDVDFKQTQQLDNCLYCSFKGVCGR